MSRTHATTPSGCLGYLSAAPTVSTRPAAASAGPRAHILGTINGFGAAGWAVRPYIVGDRLPPGVGNGRVQRLLERVPAARPLADLARLAMARHAAARAWAELGPAVDWVYERFATMQVLGRRFRKAGIPWILETQGLFFYETQVERASVGWPALARRIELAAYRDCDVLIAVSKPLEALLVERCGIDPAKILLVPNAVELDRFDPSLNGRERFFAEPTLGFVGGLIAWQALDLLLEALAALRAEGIVLGLAVIGDGAMLAPWRQRAAELGIADKVLFTGQVPGTEVGAMLARCDLGYSGPRLMAIGSMYHSPIKLYEYMAQGLPVLAAAFDDARKLVAGRGTGFLFAPGDLADLCRALREIHARRESLPRMGVEARALVAAEHSWPARVRELIPAVRAVLARRPDRLAASPALPVPSRP
jgi:glycosyltransferase involved in cell wall biosynthesis